MVIGRLSDRFSQGFDSALRTASGSGIRCLQPALVDGQEVSELREKSFGHAADDVAQHPDAVGVGRVSVSEDEITDRRYLATGTGTDGKAQGPLDTSRSESPNAGSTSSRQRAV